jgi:hypothetical protein
MSIPDDADPDILISRLAGPLAPHDRAAFRAAALDAVSRLPCQGEGAIFRAVAALQRTFFHPPNVHQAPRHDLRGNKLTGGPPIGAPDPREGARDRRRLKAAS